MKRRITCLLIIASIMCTLFALPASADNSISVWLNGEKLSFDVEPIIVNGSTLVPFRKIFEELGADVEFWDNAAIGLTKGKYLIVPIGKKEIILNNCEIPINVSARIVDGRTLVPLRVVSESLGATVEWNASTRKITITCKGDTYIDWNDNYYYWGDVADDGETATGYGAIYSNEDDSLLCWGRFENNYIFEGRYYNLGTTSFYIGEFSDVDFGCKEGKGTLYYDSDYIEGIWSNDTINGEFTASISGMLITGTATDGEWDGLITFTYVDTGESYSQLYEMGEKVNIYNADYESANSIYSNQTSNIPSAFYSAKYPLYLYSSDGKTYLGKLTTNKYDTESVSNEYGVYGSKYSRTSIFNEYGTYGSKYNMYSAFNPYASSPPIIVDSNMNFIAYLTANEYKVNGVTYLELLNILKSFYQ